MDTWRLVQGVGKSKLVRKLTPPGLGSSARSRWRQRTRRKRATERHSLRSPSVALALAIIFHIILRSLSSTPSSSSHSNSSSHPVECFKRSGQQATLAQTATQPQQLRVAATRRRQDLWSPNLHRTSTVTEHAEADNISEADQDAQMEHDGGDPEENPTIAEGGKLQKLERLRRKRRKCHAKELDAGEKQEALIAEQQAALVDLRSVADITNGQIQTHAATIDQLSSWSTELAVERACALESPPQEDVQTLPQAQVGVSYAQKLAGDLITGMHNFTNESPAVQSVLQQLVARIEALRHAQAGGPTVMDPRQRTLNSFLQQLAVPAIALLVSKSPVVPAKIQNYGISDAMQQTSPEASATTAVSDPMLVDGECPGDKRKSECL